MAATNSSNYEDAEIETALYETHHRHGQRVDRFIRDLTYHLLTEQYDFNSKRPFGESDWYAWIRDAAQKLEPEAECHGVKCNEEYEQAIKALLGYIFDAAAQKALEADSVCCWEYDPQSHSWDTACENKFQFIEGGPEENGFEHCPYCGGEVEIANAG